MVSYKVNKEIPHKCLYLKCKHCLEYVNIYEPKCFITSEEEKEFKRELQDLRRKKKKKEQLLNMVDEGLLDDHIQSVIESMIAQRKKKLEELRKINMEISMTHLKAQRNENSLNALREEVIDQLLDEGLTDDEITLKMVDERLTKLQNKEQKEEKESHISADDLIFADIECILDSSNTFIPILICYTKGDSDKIFHHWGTNCVQLFIKTMLRWVKENKKEGKPYHFTILLHTLKGFDGVFIIDALYKMNLKVTDIMATGTKMLHFKHKHLTFKDSLCFLNMPLTNFTRTFRLKELKKGWFPHKFSKLENLDYEGPIPSLQFFDPAQMNKEKKEECETWHAEQVIEGKIWNFQTEMKDTKRDVGFNPRTKCITLPLHVTIFGVIIR